MTALSTFLPSSAGRALAWVAAILALLAVVFWHGVHVTGHSDPSGKIAETIGADTCESSGYQISSKLDGSNETIYDCTMPSGAWKCVTWQGGLAHDSTATVRLLWADTLGTDQPACLG